MTAERAALGELVNRTLAHSLRALASRPDTQPTRGGVLARSLITVSLALAAFVPPSPALAFARQGGSAAEARLDVVPLSALPAQAHETHRRILAGGPFRYGKDGSVFGNRERLLPRRTRGYYREYTVSTPGSRDRGARRMVCGGTVVQSPETCFYTQDHYQSFQKIDPSR